VFDVMGICPAGLAAAGIAAAAVPYMQGAFDGSGYDSCFAAYIEGMACVIFDNGGDSGVTGQALDNFRAKKMIGIQGIQIMQCAAIDVVINVRSVFIDMHQ
jgi:hypothetical protein